MPYPLIPWQTCNVPSDIQKELNRRKVNRSFSVNKNSKWENGDWEKYKGPQTAWVRVCSNGTGLSTEEKSGFILHGGEGFYNTYGFSKSDKNASEQIIGYTADGKPHVIANNLNSNYQIHTPNPQIVRVETVIQKELFRRAWIHWMCFSPTQLQYMTPYFLSPGVTMILEFGWNNFNVESLVDLNDTKKLAEYFFKNPYPLYNENILKSNGNYDVVFGLVTNFEWSVDGNKFVCMTEITSKDRLYSGIPITAMVSSRNTDDEKDPTNEKYYSTLKNVCRTDFIKNLKKIATIDSLENAGVELSNTELLSLIKNGKKEGGAEMKEEYWRGIFYGRTDLSMKLSSTFGDHVWTKAAKGDFDEAADQPENMWINMGFLVELMNRCFPAPSPDKDRGFFEVRVDESVIGAHPNLISTDGSVLLIPNELAPKFMYGKFGLDLKQGTDYYRQYKNNPKKLSTDPSNPLYMADKQVEKVFQQSGYVIRDDLDFIINGFRYGFPTKERSIFAFPFTDEQEIKVGGRNDVIKYPPYFYGFFKDLYFNVNLFISLVEDESIKTYVDLYNAIFSRINSASGNYWDLQLMPNENDGNLMVVDRNMLPVGKDVSEPLYIDYMDEQSIMTTLGFKPKMTDAQTCRVLFSENNNQSNSTVLKSGNDLLNFKAEDRILKLASEYFPTVSGTSESTPKEDVEDDPITSELKNLQSIIASPDMYQFTVKVDGYNYYRRLVLPNSTVLDLLLSDGDTETNSKYTGPQPITVEVGLQGIGGFRTFMTFLIRNLPDPYNQNDVAYRIVDVAHTLQDGKWESVIKAGIIPLRGYVKKALNIPP